jgi:tetratricopeptide (TPR) repeat protein
MGRDLAKLADGQSLRRAYATKRFLESAKYVGLSCICLLGLALGVSFWRDGPRRPVASIRVSSPEAREAYRRGQLWFHKGSLSAFQKAEEEFQRAIRSEPTFAAAYAHLGLVYMWKARGEDKTLIEKARLAALQALRFEPDLPEGHSLLASTIQLLNHDRKGAEQELRRAYKANSASADVLYQYANNYLVLGLTNDSVRFLEKALRVESRSELRLQNAGWIYLGSRQPQKALAKFDELLALEPTSAARLAHLRIRAFCDLNDFDRAIAVEKDAALLGGQNAEQLQERFRRFEAAFHEGGPEGYWRQKLAAAESEHAGPVTLAALYARTGNRDAAFLQLESALKLDPSRLYGTINVESAFDSLRTDQRFSGLLKQLGMR